MNLYRLIFSLLLLSALVAAFQLYPSRAGLIAAGILVIGLGSSVVSSLRRQSRLYRAGQIDRRILMINSLVEITGMFLALALSILLGRLAMGYVIAQISGMWGFILGMLAAVAIGVAMSMLVQSTWGRLAKRPALG